MKESILLYIVIVGSIAMHAAEEPSFEAASVKPAATKPVPANQIMARFPIRGQMNGGPGTDDPQRISYKGVALIFLIKTAFGLPLIRIVSPPWLDQETYDIEATLPPATSQEQFQLMLQRLLRERFGLAVHRETRVFPAYEVGLAKGGAKVKPSPELGPALWKQTRDPEGVVASFRNYTMVDFAKWLEGRLANQTPKIGYATYEAASVVDKTGLDGRYDFRIEYDGAPGPGGAAPGPPSPAPLATGGITIFAAAEKQLGLKIEQTKLAVEILVVDHVDKMPTAN